MNTYIVKYIDGTDLKVAFTQGVNQKEAGEEFKKAFPDIGSEKIIDVANIDSFVDNDYSQAIGLAKSISFIGWIIAFLTIIGLFIIFSETGKYGIFAIPTAIGLLIVSFGLIVFGQSARASMDSANTSRQILLHNLAKSNK